MKIIIPYKPRYPEVHARLDGARFATLVAHRRFGKTVLAINHLIRRAAICPLPRGHFGYVAPLLHQARTVCWDYLLHFTAKIPGRTISRRDLSVRIPSVGGGAMVRLFGASNPDALRGVYFDGVVMDEVAQMKPEVWEEIIMPALADRKGFAVFIGTPKGINLFSKMYFHAVAEEAAGNREWAALRYPASETGALSAEDLERLRRELSDNKYRQEMECDFAASSDDNLISLDEARTALSRKADERLAQVSPLILGVDIARFGDDATVFFPRRGLMGMEPVVLRKRSNTEVAGALVAWIAEHKPRLVNIDQGQGTGVIDIARDLVGSGACVINEVPFGSRANSNKFVNRRSEMWHKIREWIKAGGSLPNSPNTSQALLAELTSPTYGFDAQGKIKLEPKEEIRKRLGHSTDIGDALALTFAVDLPIEAEACLGGKAGAWRVLRNRKKKVFDPFGSSGGGAV